MADDLESFWSDVRTPSTLATVSNKIGRVEVATAKAAADAARDEVASQADAEKVIRMFLQHWRAEVLAGGAGSLIELVLDSSDLDVVELEGFVHALPPPLLQRIIDQGATSSSARGIHALLAIEHHRRMHTGAIANYSLQRDADRTLLITVRRSGSAQSITFRLDETFDMSSLP